MTGKQPLVNEVQGDAMTQLAMLHQQWVHPPRLFGIMLRDPVAAMKSTLIESGFDSNTVLRTLRSRVAPRTGDPKGAAWPWWMWRWWCVALVDPRR